MRGKTVLLRLVFIAGIIFFANSQLYAQSVVLTEIEVKEDNSAVKILYATNRSIAVECYDLSVPPQIIVDFMGDVYSKEPEVRMINMGVVKQMRAIRGTKTSPDLDETYYPIDFIIIDLKESVRYDFDQGLTTSVLMVSKPGQPKQEAKAEKTQVNVQAEVMEVAEDNSLASQVQARTEEKAAEQPATKTVEVAQVNTADVSEKQSDINKEPKQKKTFKKKMTGGIKNLFTFGKAKDKTSEQIKAQQEKEAKKQKKEFDKQERIKNAENKKIAVAKKRELGSKKKLTAPSIKKPESVKVEKKKPMVNPSNQVEAAQKKVNDLNAETLKATEQLQMADAQVIAAEKDKDTIAERVEFSKAKAELAKDAYDTSLKHMQIAKSAANSVWLEYSNAKAKLSLYLENGTEESVVSEAQKTYDAKKTELENVIKAAEIAKKESDAKLEEYNKLKQESETLVAESQNPAKSVAKVKEDYAAKESNLKNIQKKLEIAMQELETANIAVKRYELEKADEEYKKSLNVIDSQIVKQMEEEQKKAAEEARLQKIEEEKSARDAELKKTEEEKLAKQESLKKLEAEKRLKEQTRSNTLEAEKAKEEAQIAALKALKEDQIKQTDENSRATSKRAEVRLTSKKVNMPEKKAVKKENNLRSEVLESAVELRNAGLEMQRNGDFDSAVKYYQQALMQDPKYATVHNDLGILYEQKGLEDKAKMEYLTTLQIDPQYIKAHSNLALLYEKSGDYKKAYYHWKQRVNLGVEDDPWTLKAKQRMQLLENRK